MTKIGFKKELKHLYNPSAKKVELVDVPMMNFLMSMGLVIQTQLLNTDSK